MKNKYLIISIVSLLLLIIGVSYAFFTTRIIGTGKSILVQAKDLRIIFTDTQEISDDNIAPGWQISKNFTVENLTSDIYNYNIVIDDLVNTFVSTGLLQYKIESNNGGYSTNWTDVPKAASATKATIAYNVSIASGVLQTYTITFRYVDGTNPQSDMGKTLSGHLEIETGTIPTYTVSMDVIGGSSLPTSKSINMGGYDTFTITPNSGYTLTGATVSCTQATASINESTGVVTVSNVIQSQTCAVTLAQVSTYTVDMNVTNGTSSSASKLIAANTADTFTVTPNSGYTLTGATVSCTQATASINESTGVVTISNVTENNTCTVTLPAVSTTTYTITYAGFTGTISLWPTSINSGGSVSISDFGEHCLSAVSCYGASCVVTGSIFERALTISNPTRNVDVCCPGTGNVSAC